MQTVMFDNLETESQTHRKRRVNARENNTYLNTISSSSVVVLPFIPQTLFWFSWIFDFPGEPTRRRRGWITFTIRCFYRRYVKSVFVLSLHFFSCFLVWFVITIMWRLYLLSSSNRDQNWEKERPRYECESFASLKFESGKQIPLCCKVSMCILCAR